ncbi:MAG: recombination factor protein RarA [Gammaproteobacteria bacterium]|nr:MAG: recombination factor protein RarA [Pseudomonadota bacterium]PIE38036.1 MAG: recombination factor protein RarA [Gammaproteobacteria bacterium]
MSDYDLFANREDSDAWQPLAARLRPAALEHFIGQQHLLGEGQALRTMITSGRLHSMIFWGPPGVGKTSLAKVISKECHAGFLSISAVLGGVKDIRQAVETAKIAREMKGEQTVLFVDEVHRLNKAQQDLFLPFVENGTIVFIGATTENPSFELNNALLSRSRVYVLKSLGPEELNRLIDIALNDPRGGLAERQILLPEEYRQKLVSAADGDARRLLNLVEIAADLAETVNGRLVIDEEVMTLLLQGDHRRFDKGGDIFYEQISALHKSVRGSSPDGALYWMVRMLDGGCDPLYIARRVVRMASEDIGNADPRALRIALDAWDVVERLGSPEGELSLAQAVVYLASAPKSNAVYKAYNKAVALVKDSPACEVPMHLRNAPTSMMKELDYGSGYRYAHDEEGGYAAGENYFPKELTGTVFYEPVPRGMEIKIREKLQYLRKLDEQSPVKR